ncbi:MAG: hypothetical protein AB4426_18275 [Xenococcaceae cyanobacterium]
MRKLQELSKTQAYVPNVDSVFLLLTKVEGYQLLVEWNDSQAEYP